MFLKRDVSHSKFACRGIAKSSLISTSDADRQSISFTKPIFGLMMPLKSAFFTVTLLVAMTLEMMSAAVWREDLSFNQVVSAYFSEWALFTDAYTVADIPADRITHIIYAFIQIKDGEVTFFDRYAALEAPLTRAGIDNWPDGNLAQLRQLRAHHPHLELLVALGGWTLSSPFSDAVLTSDSRYKLAKSIVHFLREHGLDGIDLDWEYPVAGGLASNQNRPEDRENYTLFVAELRHQLDLAAAGDRRRYRITVASPVSRNILQHFELQAMARHIDWFHVMAYDYNGAWELTTGHLAPLDGDNNRESIRKTIKAYRDAGVPAHKIVLGIPLYARAWSDVDLTGNGLHQKAGSAYTGTTEAGYLSYRQLRQRVQVEAENYQEYFDPIAQAGFIFNPTLANGTFFTAETVPSFLLKKQFAREQGLRGIMFWSLEGAMPDLQDPDSLLGRLPSVVE